MRLRYEGQCSSCGISLDKGSKAEWDRANKSVRCLACASGPVEGASLGPVVDASQRRAPSRDARPAAIDPGLAGASARHEFERRHQRREQRIEQKWGKLAPLVKVLSDDPQSTTAWAKGADGEQRLARHLRRVLGDRAVILDDRRVPRTRGNIDHLAIAASGVWVIDAKNYGGKVERRDVGGLFRVDNQLYVGGRRHTGLVTALGWQVEAVRVALQDESVRVHSVLCFTNAEWPFFAKPFQLDDVWVTWADALADLIARPGTLDGGGVSRVAAQLSQRLPANT